MSVARLTRHLLLMTATPHKGKPADFQLFLALLDSDRFEGRFRDGVHYIIERHTPANSKSALEYFEEAIRHIAIGLPQVAASAELTANSSPSNNHLTNCQPAPAASAWSTNVHLSSTETMGTSST